MRARNYLMLCAGVAAVVVLAVLVVPGVGDAFEGALLGFLATYAR